jgi:hypothetical protein
MSEGANLVILGHSFGENGARTIEKVANEN